MSETKLLLSPICIGKRADNKNISVVSTEPQVLVILHQDTIPTKDESKQSNFIPLNNLIRFAGHPNAFEWNRVALKKLGLSND